MFDVFVELIIHIIRIMESTDFVVVLKNQLYKKLYSGNTFPSFLGKAYGSLSLSYKSMGFVCECI